MDLIRITTIGRNNVKLYPQEGNLQKIWSTAEDWKYLKWKRNLAPVNFIIYKVKINMNATILHNVWTATIQKILA